MADKKKKNDNGFVDNEINEVVDELNEIENEVEEIEEQAVEAQKQNAARSKKFLALYIIGLFSVALVLIILSYLTQVRANDELEQYNSIIGEQTEEIQGAQLRAEQLQSLVNEQNTKIKNLETENAEIPTLERQNELLNLMIDLQKSFYLNDIINTPRIIVEIETGFMDILQGELLTEFVNIKGQFVENNGEISPTGELIPSEDN